MLFNFYAIYKFDLSIKIEMDCKKGTFNHIVNMLIKIKRMNHGISNLDMGDGNDNISLCCS